MDIRGAHNEDYTRPDVYKFANGEVEQTHTFYELIELEKYDVNNFIWTSKRLIFVFWGDKFCKLVKVDSDKNVLTLQCGDVYKVDINGKGVDSQGGKRMHKKRKTKRNKTRKTKKTRKHKKTRR